MTAEERKAARLRRLVSEINEDLLALMHITERAKTVLTGINAKSGPVPDQDLMAMSGYLHHFYTGIEAIFERISRNIDGGAGKAGDWHRELLRSMTLEIPGLRPRVISPELMDELDEYRRFRHLFRHAYAGELRWSKMYPLAGNMGDILMLLQNSIKEFEMFILRIVESFEK